MSGPAVPADGYPTVSPRRLARVDHDGAIVKLDELVLVAQSVQQFISPPACPMVIAVNNVGPHEVEPSLEVPDGNPDRRSVVLHCSRDQQAAAAALNGTSGTAKHHPPVLNISSSLGNVLRCGPSLPMVVAVPYPGLVVSTVRLSVYRAAARFPAIVDYPCSAVGAIHNRCRVGRSPFSPGSSNPIRADQPFP